jgi:hypothetical protein
LKILNYSNALKKSLKNATEIFEVIGNIKTEIKAFRDIDNEVIYIPQSEKNINKILSNTILQNNSDKQKIQIKAIDKKRTENQTLTVAGKEEIVACYKATYKDCIEEKPTTMIDNSTHITAGKGAIVGENNTANKETNFNVGLNMPKKQ